MTTGARSTDRLMSRLAHFWWQSRPSGPGFQWRVARQALAFREVREALDVNRDRGERGCREGALRRRLADAVAAIILERRQRAAKQLPLRGSVAEAAPLEAHHKEENKQTFT